MLRAFENNTRIATAVVLKDNTLLQVYPEKKTFATEESWKATFPSATFQTEEKKPSQPRKRTPKNLLKHITFPKETDTPMQKTVRQLFAELGLTDSIGEYMGVAAYPRRNESGLSVFIPEEGRVVPVHFNRTSGRVWFGGRDQANTSPAGLFFFRKHGYDLHRVVPFLVPQTPDQKVVVFRNYRGHMSSIQSSVRTLREAGFYVLFWNGIYRPAGAALKAVFELPNFAGLLGYDYSESSVEVYHPPEKSTWMQPYKRMLLSAWIADTKGIRA